MIKKGRPHLYARHLALRKKVLSWIRFWLEFPIQYSDINRCISSLKGPNVCFVLFFFFSKPRSLDHKQSKSNNNRRWGERNLPHVESISTLLPSVFMLYTCKLLLKKKRGGNVEYSNFSFEQADTWACM